MISGTSNFSSKGRRVYTISIVLVIVNFGILLLVSLFLYFNHLNNASLLKEKTAIQEQIRKKINAIDVSVEGSGGGYPKEGNGEKLSLYEYNKENTKKLSDAVVLLAELNSLSKSTSFNYDSSLMIQLFINGGVVVFSLLGMILTIIALVSGIFFRDLKEKIGVQVQEKVEAELQPTRVLTQLKSILDLSKSNISTGYMYYEAYNSMKEMNSALAKVMIKKAVLNTTVALISLLHLKRKTEETPLGDSSAEIKSEYKNQTTLVERSYLWARCNICFYLVEADKCNLLNSSHLSSQPWIRRLFKEFETNNILDLIANLRFGMSRELADIENNHDRWYELMDSALYCEFHFFKKQISGDKGELDVFKKSVKEMLNSETARKSVNWRQKHELIWNSRLEELESMSLINSQVRLGVKTP